MLINSASKNLKEPTKAFLRLQNLEINHTHTDTHTHTKVIKTTTNSTNILSASVYANNLKN